MSSVSEKTFFGHPKGLAILFFTEMWERFSYYGMRALLVLYLTGRAIDGGYGWDKSDALILYGWYTALVYIVSIPGGIIADRLLGQKKSVMIGGFLLVIGHFLMAFADFSIFITALSFIIAGTGMLKPNISTMVGGLYKDGDNRRDSGFMIFYMGINLGALLSGIIVGIVADIYGWHMGFTLAGIGMLLGQIVFIIGQKHLKSVGNLVKKGSVAAAAIAEQRDEKIDSAPGKPLTKVEKDRLIVMGFAIIVVVVFWMAFEQAGGLMNLYTDSATDRNFFGVWEIPAAVFQSLNAGFILIFGSIVALFWANRFRKKKRASSVFKMGIGTIILGLGFIFMVIASNQSGSIDLTSKEGESINVLGNTSSFIEVTENEKIKKSDTINVYIPVENSSIAGIENLTVKVDENLIHETFTSVDAKKGDHIPESAIFEVVEGENAGKLFAVGTIDIYQNSIEANSDNINLNIVGPRKEKLEETGDDTKEASIISIINVKSGMIWLVLAYLLHTIGELCLSPVALSYITKLAPKRMVASMMGVFFAFTGCANFLAAFIGRKTEVFGELTIFIFLVIFPVVVGLGLILISRKLEKLAHGAEGQASEPYPDEEWSVNPVVEEDQKSTEEVL